MSAGTDTAATRLRPFWGRVAVMESPVDETERESGIVLPHKFDGDEGVKRGVVLYVDVTRMEPTESVDELRPGTVVYYRGGVRVLDQIILQREEILAFEAPE